MELEHIGVAANSETDSDRFFVELLGLQKTRSFSVSADLTQALFGLARETSVLRYGSDAVSIEVFITEDDSRATDVFSHPCLMVADRAALAERAKAMGLDVRQVPKPGGDSYLLFIKDFFGNMYEIKQA